MASEPVWKALAEAPQSGSRVLFSDPSCSITLAVYAPDSRQEPHAHELPSVAVLLAGSLMEQMADHEAFAERAWVGIKPDGLRHSNVYGPEGAILLSVSIKSPELWRRSAGHHGWAWKDGCGHLAQLAVSAVTGRLPFSDFAAELVAAPLGEKRPTSVPPHWLRSARGVLCCSPDIALHELAARAGVHRVHLCRSFSRWYGESVSQFRLRRRAELALRDYLHRSAPAAAAAFDAGFADQSHFARTVKSLTGVTPRNLRRLGRQVT